MTKNLHLEHPEDAILTGDRNALLWLFAPSTVSVKIDGAPAIVWGTNPENGKFFVGTKSVFNKKKIKICYTPQDIEFHYSEQEEVAEILLTCLDFLPRTENIYQGDFMSFGGFSACKPNTIVYDFGYDVKQAIVIAPHTQYTGDSIKDAVANPLTTPLDSDENVLFIQPTVDSTVRVHHTDVDWLKERFDKAESEGKFLSEKETKEVKVIINAFIREKKELDVKMLTLILGDENLAELYSDIMLQKDFIIGGMVVYDGPKAFAGGQPIVAEGFVRSNKYGTMKLVDRLEFSHLNFNNGKFQSFQ